MSDQAFYYVDRRTGFEHLVQVSSCEDRGDHYYVSWHPVHRFCDGHDVPGSYNLGSHGCTRFYKDKRYGETFRRAPYKVVDVPRFGVGQIALRPI